MKIGLFTYTKVHRLPDAYNYAFHFSKKHQLFYLAFECKTEKLIKNVDYRLIKEFRIGTLSKVLNRVSFALIAREILSSCQIAIVPYFRGCSFLCLVCWGRRKDLVLDIRSGSVKRKGRSRRIDNLILTIEALVFKRRVFITKDLCRYLGFGTDDAISFVSVGGDAPYNRFRIRKFDNLRLLYVGTLTDRNIEVVVKGFIEYLKRTSDSGASLRIVGSGLRDEEANLRNLSASSEFSDQIEILGWANKAELTNYFIESNVGVSFVPIREQYLPQPVTKTYEYLSCGMAVIATDVPFNRDVMEPYCGMVISDNMQDFAKALYAMKERLPSFSSVKIASNPRITKWSVELGKLERSLARLSSKQEELS